MTNPAPPPGSDEIARLRVLLAERDAAFAAQSKTLEEERSRAGKLAEKVKVLEHQLSLLKRQLFGKKSERLDPAQLLLAFDDACAEAGEHVPLDDEPYPADLLEELAKQEIDDDTGKPRRKRRSTKFPPDLEVVQGEETHPTPAALQCECGCEKVRMGEERSRKLEMAPKRFFWREVVRVKYACPGCGTITRPPLPPEPIEKGLAGPSLLAEVLINKHCDHLPLARQETIFARQGVLLSKSTLCSWVDASTGLLEAVADEVGRQVASRPIAQTDETGILVLDRDHPEGRSKGRMWVYCGERGELFYEYTPTKETRWPKARLADFNGILQADAYPGFDALFKEGSGILEAGCNAHARRKFRDAHDAEPTRQEPKWALLVYQRLFAVEREAKEQGLDAEARLALRREKSAPLMAKLYAWLEQLKPKLVPSDPLYKAVRYALNHREALCRSLEDGRVELHNNRSELSLRQVAVGRNNWLFAGSPDGARRAAIAYTLIMSCKELGVPVQDYLIDVLQRVSSHPHALLHELTPRGWKAVHDAATSAEASSSS